VPTVKTDTTRQLLHDIVDAVDNELIGRRTEAELLALATVARLNLFLLGEPGIAKSMVADQFFARIDAVTFRLQLAKTTAPSEMIGPISVPALKAGEPQTFLTTGYMPEAHFVMLDEVMRGSSAIQNLTLEAMNEGTYRNRGQRLPIKAIFFLGTSNSLPTGPDQEELAASMDRWVLRKQVTGVESIDDQRRLLTTTIDPAPTKLLDVDDLPPVHREVAGLKVDDATIDGLIELRRKLADAGILVSDRRFRQAVRVAQGRAWLEGASTVDVGHLEDVSYVFWHEPDQIAKVTRIVLDVAAPGQAKVIALSDAVTELVEQIAEIDKSVATGTSPGDAMAQRIEVRDKLIDAKNKVRDLPTVSGRTGRLVDELRSRVEDTWTALHDSMGMPGQPGDGVWLAEKK